MRVCVDGGAVWGVGLMGRNSQGILNWNYSSAKINVSGNLCREGCYG